MHPRDRLFLTGDDEADRLLVSEPMALLIGFALDQQVPVQKAFSGPKVLLDRLGTIDAATARVDRPGTAGGRLQGTRRRSTDSPAPWPSAFASWRPTSPNTYDGDAARLWTDASDARDLKRRIAALPGFGQMKVASLFAVLTKRLGIHPAGWEEELPSHPTLGDVDSAAALAVLPGDEARHESGDARSQGVTRQATLTRASWSS